MVKAEVEPALPNKKIAFQQVLVVNGQLDPLEPTLTSCARRMHPSRGIVVRNVEGSHNNGIGDVLGTRVGDTVDGWDRAKGNDQLEPWVQHERPDCKSQGRPGQQD